MGVVSFWVVDGHAVTFLINVDIFCVSCIPFVCKIVYVWLLFAFCFSFRLIFTSFMMKAFLQIPLMMILWRYFPEFYLILSKKKKIFWHISLILLTFFVFHMTLFIDIYLHFFFLSYWSFVVEFSLTIFLTDGSWYQVQFSKWL